MDIDRMYSTGMWIIQIMSGTQVLIPITPKELSQRDEYSAAENLTRPAL